MDTIADFAATGGPVFLLVLCRIMRVMMLAPVFGSAMAPAPVKIFLSVVLSLLFFPLVQSKGAPVAIEGTVLALAVAWELAVGLLIGFASAMLFAGVQLGGHLI